MEEVERGNEGIVHGADRTDIFLEVSSDKPD